MIHVLEADSSTSSPGLTGASPQPAQADTKAILKTTPGWQKERHRLPRPDTGNEAVQEKEEEKALRDNVQ